MKEQVGREVNFGLYCNDCRYSDRSEHEQPCDDCLSEPINDYTSKPVKWVEKK